MNVYNNAAEVAERIVGKKDNRRQEKVQLWIKYLADKTSEKSLMLLTDIYESMVQRILWDNLKVYNDNNDYEDCFQEARIALVRAIRRFDPDRGVLFYTYAHDTIIGAVKRYFRDQTHTIRIPAWAQELKSKLDKTGGTDIDHLEQYSPEFQRVLQDGYILLSLDGSTDDTGLTISESLAGELNTEDTGLTNVLVEKFLRGLQPKDQAILIEYLKGYNISEISRIVGLSVNYTGYRFRRIISGLKDRALGSGVENTVARESALEEEAAMGKRKRSKDMKTDVADGKEHFFTLPPGKSSDDQAIELSPRELETAMLLWPVLPAGDSGESVQINYDFLGDYLNILPGTAEEIVRRLVTKGVVHSGTEEGDGLSRGCPKISISANSNQTIDNKIIRPGRTYTLNVLGAKREEGLITTGEDSRPPLPVPPPPSPPPSPRSRYPRFDQGDSSIPKLSRQEALIAMIIWPVLTKEKQIDHGFVAKKIGTASNAHISALMARLVKKGMIATSKRRWYIQAKAKFMLTDYVGKPVKLDALELKCGIVYDLSQMALQTYETAAFVSRKRTKADITGPNPAPPPPLNLNNIDTIILERLQLRRTAVFEEVEDLKATVEAANQMLVEKQKELDAVDTAIKYFEHSG